MSVAVVHHSALDWIIPVVVILVIGAVVYLVAYQKSKKNNVELDVPVGVAERHTVHYFRKAFTGRVRIVIDDVTVQSNLELIMWKLEKRYEVQVGQTERHMVTFVKTRKKLAPGFRKQTVVAYIDGEGLPSEATHSLAS